ncbi:MAG: type II toxin-antitoxin system HicA family toxin [Candidatus Aenigmarchaeota archaeon]|nr:type II toxin-antitoxin system HicA family toxin [Candidatus Aenigmarchaeota archaeon]
MKLPLADAKDVIKVLLAKGYAKIGQSGSHAQFKNNQGTVITVPIHPGRPIGRGLLRKIMRDLEVSREEFMELLGRAR